jgi:hypothetical protein
MFVLIAAWHIFAAEALDIEMTDQEKKQTGVYKLDDRQKASLQKWIDNHYDKKSNVSEAEKQPITGSHPTLSENLMESRYLRLSDNTLWNVRREDVLIAQGWITPSEIIITQSTDPFFPKKLTNKVTGSSVLARKVDKLPPQESPQLAPSKNQEVIPMTSSQGQPNP